MYSIRWQTCHFSNIIFENDFRYPNLMIMMMNSMKKKMIGTWYVCVLISDILPINLFMHDQFNSFSYSFAFSATNFQSNSISRFTVCATCARCWMGRDPSSNIWQIYTIETMPLFGNRNWQGSRWNPSRQNWIVAFNFIRSSNAKRFLNRRKNQATNSKYKFQDKHNRY